MNKRFVAGVLAFTLVFGGAAAVPQQAFSNVFGISASADDALEKDGFKYYLDNGAAVIVGYDGAAECTIPSKLDGYDVMEIRYSAFKNSGITSLSIPSTVTKIGNEAFRDCLKLTKVSIPASITADGGIAERVFMGCKSLKEVTIAKGYAAPIGESMFQGCTSLTTINIPEGVAYIYGSAFESCTSLAELTLPSSIVSIGSYAFQNCSSLKKMAIPAKTEKICFKAFKGCSTLNDLTIADSTISLEIQNECFTGCDKLKTVTLPGRTVTLGNSVFYGDKSLTEVKFGKGFKADIPESFCNSCSSLKTVNIPEGVANISDYAFQNCTRLSDLTLPKGLVTIGYSAFKGCGMLPKVFIADSVTKIGGSAFQNCERLESIEMPDSDVALEIGWSSFENCDKLKSLTLPGRVAAVDNYAFNACDSLAEVTFGEGFKANISAGMFQYCAALKSVDIPVGVENVGESAFRECAALKTVTLPDGLNYIESSAFSACKVLTAIKIPESVIDIGSYAFQNDEALETIEFVDGETSLNIGYQAFSNCGVKELVIPVRLNNADSYAFQSCNQLKKVTFAEGCECDVYNDMFSSCEKLASVELADGMRGIKDSAFYNSTNMKVISIPASVDVIAENSIGFGGFWSEEKAQSLLIKCFKDSAAHQYAIDNGFKFWLYDGGEPEPEIDLDTPEIVYGDVNGDGAVDQADADELYKYVFDGEKIPEEVADAADVDGNGKVDADDYNALLEKAELPKDYVPEPEKVAGDMNVDGELTKEDADALYHFLNGTGEKDENADADVNGDGKVNNDDYAELLKKLDLAEDYIPEDAKPSEPEKVAGDMNNDGELTKEDADALYHVINGTAEKDENADADVNGDGKVDDADYAELLKKAGLAEDYVPDDAKQSDPEEPADDQPTDKDDKSGDTDTPAEPDKPKTLLGDLNGDGSINVADISLLAAHVKGVKELKDEELGDINGDGSINVADISKVAAHVKGIKELA